MGLKFCNPSTEADAPLQGLMLKSLFDNMKCTTWMVLISVGPKKNFVERIASGVSVSEHGFIITSSFQLEMAREIHVRGFKDETFIPAKRVSFVGDEVGLALLKIDQGCDFAEVENDPNLIPGRDVYAIAPVMSLSSFTLMTGYLASGLRKKDQVGIKTKGLDEFIAEKLDHKVQLLTICGFNSHLNNAIGMQALGTPVFNSKGQVIGVIVASDSGFDYAVPSSCLFQMLEAIRQQVMPTVGESGEASTQKSSIV